MFNQAAPWLIILFNTITMREKRSIFTLEQLRRKIYELTGVVVAIATLSDKVQKKAYDVSQDKHENEQHIYKNTSKNRNVRIVIVELTSGNEFELCFDCTSLFHYLHHPDASFALKIVDEDKPQDLEFHEGEESFYELPLSTENAEFYDDPDVFYVEDNSEAEIYSDTQIGNFEDNQHESIHEHSEMLTDQRVFEQEVECEDDELPPRLYPEVERENFVIISGEKAQKTVNIDNTLSPHQANDTISTVDHEKFLDPSLQPETSTRAEFLLSKNCTPTLLTVPCSNGYVRQYRLSCDKGQIKYYRCSRCDYICRKLHLKLRSYVKVKNGQVITDLETVEHHPSCLPIPALQAIAKDIDRKCRLRVKKQKTLPKISYHQGLEDLMKIASKKNLNVNPEKLQSYFPSWKGVRVQYRRLLGQCAHPKAQEIKSSKFPTRYRSKDMPKKILEPETMVINVDHLDDIL
uniref:RYYR-CCHC domain-containing protein n=1 Tax=Acrobeloides nanus TaxID=290746 RepID=A0A914BWU2_9BILA